MAQHQLGAAMTATPTQVTFLGHATFKFTTPESKVVLVDPWTFGNPLCRDEDKVVGHVDLILITHGHHDHLGDVRRIAATGAPEIVVVPELGRWLGAQGLENIRTMNLGGILELEGVRVTMTPAAHSSSVDDEPYAYVGVAAGFVVEFSDGARIYHAGDTAAFSGMQLIAEVYQPEVALLPMGDHHTMAPPEAAVAARLLQAPRVVPMHYGITPESRRAPTQFRTALDGLGLGHVEVVEMVPGQMIEWPIR
jgi:L-ascorbate metabolism protein UlaG (beta-lactamase superfamily)